MRRHHLYCSSSNRIFDLISSIHFQLRQLGRIPPYRCAGEAFLHRREGPASARVAAATGLRRAMASVTPSVIDRSSDGSADGASSGAAASKPEMLSTGMSTRSKPPSDEREASAAPAGSASAGAAVPAKDVPAPSAGGAGRAAGGPPKLASGATPKLVRGADGRVSLVSMPDDGSARPGAAVGGGPFAGGPAAAAAGSSGRDSGGGGGGGGTAVGASRAAAATATASTSSAASERSAGVAGGVAASKTASATSSVIGDTDIHYKLMAPAEAVSSGSTTSAAHAPASFTAFKGLALPSAGRGGAGGPGGEAVGVFKQYETLQEQMARLSRLRRTAPQYAAALMEQGMVMEQMAAEGRVDDIESIVSRARAGEVLYWFTAKMFRAAALRGHLKVLQFMFSNGLPPAFPGLTAVLQEICEHTRNGVGSSGESAGHAGGADAAGSAALELDEVTACAVLDLCFTNGWDVNAQRNGDYRAPLHIACLRGLNTVVDLLLARGADPNIVAADDEMPLTCALQHLERVRIPAVVGRAPEEAAVASAEALVSRLNVAGAMATWRRPEPEEGGEGGGDAAGGDGDAEGAGLKRDDDGGFTFEF